ncbi:Uncharacterised protein [Vibrio cholerae]|nr:Uncharacterised protein [Vibrio cholerae]
MHPRRCRYLPAISSTYRRFPWCYFAFLPLRHALHRPPPQNRDLVHPLAPLQWQRLKPAGSFVLRLRQSHSTLR